MVQPARFQKTSPYWNDDVNRDFFDALGKKLCIICVISITVHDISKLDDWYTVYGQNLRKKIHEFGGSGLLSHFGGSIPKGSTSCLKFKDVQPSSQYILNIIGTMQNSPNRPITGLISKINIASLTSWVKS